MKYAELSMEEKKEQLKRAQIEFDCLYKLKLSLDLSRGKPIGEQLDLSNELFTILTGEHGDYIGERGKNMVPGKNIAKSPYVINTGANDAYIRIRVMIPSDANRDYWQARSGGVIESQFCTTAITSGEFMHGKRTDYPIIDASGKGYVDGNGVKYDVYTFIRTEPLKPGEMTEWNVWNFIGIADEATSANIQKAVDKGAILVSEDGTMTVNVLVQADAIQAEGFANAKAAFAAFDAQA